MTKSTVYQASAVPVGQPVDLSAYAGQTIVLELTTNGHHSGGSDIMREMYQSGELQTILEELKAPR